MVVKTNILLGVNIDHVASVRQSRGTRYPDPLQAAYIAEEAGADSITVHLREDRRHIQEFDVMRLQDMLLTRLNLEMAVTQEMVAFAERVKPADCCLVPERREELTTEGGLDVVGQFAKVTEACARLKEAGIRVSIFIDAELDQIAAAAKAGAPAIEIHTGRYAEAITKESRQEELKKIIEAVRVGSDLGLQVNAGHGLNYQNVSAIAQIAAIHELNIGHAIIARALFTGLGEAVREMKRLMTAARQ